MLTNFPRAGLKAGKSDVATVFRPAVFPEIVMLSLVDAAHAAAGDKTTETARNTFEIVRIIY